MSYTHRVGGTMERCLTCGAAIAPWWYDVYCRRRLDQVYEALAQMLLDVFPPRDWVIRRRPRRAPAGESRW